MRAQKVAFFAAAVLLFATMARAQTVIDGYIVPRLDWFGQAQANLRAVPFNIFQSGNAAQCAIAQQPGAHYSQYLGRCYGIDVRPAYVGREYDTYGFAPYSMYAQEREVYPPPQAMPQRYGAYREPPERVYHEEPRRREPDEVLFLNQTGCEMKLDDQEVAVNGVLSLSNDNPLVQVKSKTCEVVFTDVRPGVVAIECR